MVVKRHLRAAVAAVGLFLILAAGADAATLSVSASGSDASACTQAAPCRSFNGAYQRAAAGDVIEVGGGSYGAQSIAARTLSGSPVTIRPAAGATVTLTGSLDINTDNIVVRDVKANDLNVDNGSDVLTDVTTINIDAVSAYFQNTKNLVVKGGRLGGLNNKTPVYVGAWPMSYNVTFDGVTFHDATVNDSTVHTECLMVNDVQGMTIRNSSFRNCGYFGLMISHLMGELAPRDVTLENNVFEQTYQWNGQPAPYSMLIGPIDANHFVIRNNTFVTEPTFNNTTWSNGAEFVGNLGALNSCQSGAGYAKNVWTNVACGASDKKTTNLTGQFVDPASHNWRLKPGASAIDAASSTDYPPTDHDGGTRPSGAAPDAGAYEYAAATIPADTTPPETTISSAPPTTTTSTSAGLTFSSTESSSTFECQIDGGAWATCQSPKSYSGLALGAHTFSVRAIDPAGNVDASPAAVTWTVVTAPDTTAPDTVLSSPMPSTTTSTEASFSFSATESGASFTCSLDGAPWVSCTSPRAYTSLGVGSHAFAVRATDPAGNVDGSPASVSWTILAPPDTTAPETTLTAGPTSGTSTDASFAFVSSEAASTFDCRLDGAAWTACASPVAFTSLAVGTHVFAVRATDAAGNADATPATMTWSISALALTDPPVVSDPAPKGGKGKSKPRTVTTSVSTLSTSTSTTTICRTGTSKCPSSTSITVASSDVSALSVRVSKRSTATGAQRRPATVTIGSRSDGRRIVTISARRLSRGTYVVTIIGHTDAARSTSRAVVLRVR